MNGRLYNAASAIAEALSGLHETEKRKAVLMALIAGDDDGLLVDPATIGVREIIGMPGVPTVPQEIKSPSDQAYEVTC